MKHQPVSDLDIPSSEALHSSELGRYLEIDDRTLGRLYTPAFAQSKAEKSPDYYRVIAYLNSDWRLILCKGGFQWILQKKRGSEWKNRWFVRTKSGLHRGLRALQIEEWGEINESALRRMHELPERL